MCLYKVGVLFKKGHNWHQSKQGPSETCAKEAICGRFTDIVKKEIVDRHNELMKKIAKGEQKGLPAAADMEKKVIFFFHHEISIFLYSKFQTCSDELAEIAQSWADQCQFNHDKHRNTLDGTYVGQNARVEDMDRDIDDEDKV